MFAPPAMRLMTLFVAGLSLACGEPLSPRDVAGAYALQRVAGNSLPTIQYANGYVVVRVFAETLSFSPDGRGEDVTAQQNETVTGGLVTSRERRETAFGYRVMMRSPRTKASRASEPSPWRLSSYVKPCSRR